MRDKLNFITTSPGFKYSVNIKYDLNDFVKINSYIPTAGSVRLFQEFFDAFSHNSVTRSHLLIGSYGTGKSLFATILGTLLANKDRDKFSGFIEKIERLDPRLAERIRFEFTSKNKYLLVLPSSDESSFKRAMLIALEKALQDEGLTDLFPSTYFTSVLNKLEQWERQFSSTFQEVAATVEADLGLGIEQFKEKISSFDQNSYEYFVKIYPGLTSGGDFNPFFGCSLNDVYEEVTRKLLNRGYQGIYIIFDEFNKLLENDIEIFDGKALQDFAEMTSRSEENEIHLLLISHKGLLQYTSNLSPEQINEWKKIEGRFKKLDIVQYSTQVYELVSNVILKDKVVWGEFKRQEARYFDLLKGRSIELGIFPELDSSELTKNVIEGCYPLHPLATFALPRISQRVAQNERTIFTFLSTNDRATLGEYLEEKVLEDEFQLIYLDRIYDYFAGLMQQEFEYSQVYQAWADSQRALQKLGKASPIETKIVKSLAIIYAVNSFSTVPPSEEILRFALFNYPEGQIDRALKGLLDRKIILYRRSIQQYKFFNGSDIDIKKIVEEKKAQKKDNFSAKYLLEEYFKPFPVLPKSYNDDNKITRFFYTSFMSASEILQITKWQQVLEQEDFADGMIVYAVCESSKQIEEVTQFTLQFDNEEASRIIFVIPQKPLKIIDMLRDLDALIDLSKSVEFINGDEVIKIELSAYIDDVKRQIENRLARFFEPQHSQALYVYQGKKEFDIHSYRDLSIKISRICREIFALTPVINNELLVKNKITGVQKNARKTLVQEVLFGDLSVGLNISGYGPEYLIYRSFFLNTGLLVNRDNRLVNCFENVQSDALRRLYQTIERFFNEAETTPQSFDKLYNELRRPPYGLRLGIIPLFLALYSRRYLQGMTIRYNKAEVIISAEVFENINAHPSRFTLEIDEWNQVNEEYISFIESFVQKYLDESRQNPVNRLHSLQAALTKWFQSLPKYARDTNKISSTALVMREVIRRQNPEVKRVFLELIPQKLVAKNLSEETIILIRESIKDFFTEHKQAFERLIMDVEFEIIDMFDNGQRSMKEALCKWYSELKDEIKKHSHSKEINGFIDIINKLYSTEMNSIKLIDRLAIVITGFNVEDWNDSTHEEFLSELRKIKEVLEGFQTGDMTFSTDFKIVLESPKGKVERTMEKVDIQGIAQLLENKIRGSLRDVGSAVSDQQKQQILLNILQDLIQ